MAYPKLLGATYINIVTYTTVAFPNHENPNLIYKPLQCIGPVCLIYFVVNGLMKHKEKQEQIIIKIPG